MKKFLPLTVIVATSMLLLYAFTYFFVLPKSAQVLIPNNWNTVLLHQKRMAVVTYLGAPLDSALKTSNDKWIVRNGNFTFTLSIDYLPADSISEHYKICYDFNNKFFIRSGVLEEESIK